MQGIQDGYASSNLSPSGVRGNSNTINPGKIKWGDFFNRFSDGANDDELVALWGIAEAESTQHGEAIAEARSIHPNAAEQVFVTTGNAYWWAAANQGLGFWALVVSSITGVNPVVSYVVGDWFNDPRSVDPIYGKSPVYWYSSAIWKVQEWFLN